MLNLLTRRGDAIESEAYQKLKECVCPTDLSCEYGNP